MVVNVGDRAETYDGHRDVKLLFRCDPAKNVKCKKTMCYLDGPDSCTCTSNPEFSTDGKILWPAFTVEPGRKVGCKSCPLGSEACAGFRRGTTCGECPCDVYDTYTDYIKAEEDAE